MSLKNVVSDLLKGRALPEGTIRTHGGVKKIKKNGKWVSLKGGKGRDVRSEQDANAKTKHKTNIPKDKIIRLKKDGFKQQDGTHGLDIWMKPQGNKKLFIAFDRKKGTYLSRGGSSSAAQYRAYKVVNS